MRLPAALVLRECLVEPLLDLDHAEVGRLQFEGCELRRGVCFENAKVHGGLRIGLGTQLGEAGGVSVAGSHASIDGPVIVEGEGTRLEGGLRLVGASVGGTLTVAGGAQVFADQDGRAVNADGLGAADQQRDHFRVDDRPAFGDAVDGVRELTWVGDTLLEHVADHVPKAQMQEIPDAGHAAPLTHPGALAEALTEFVPPAHQTA